MTSRKEELNNLDTLTLEKIIFQKEKELSCTAILLLFLLPLTAAFYHIKYGGFIIDYDILPKEKGFVVFAVLSVVLPVIAAQIHKYYWKGYNNRIEKANDEILSIIKEGKVTPDEEFRLKKLYVEANIGKDRLKQDEFLWHTKHVCWGCGKVHKDSPKPFNYEKIKVESWKETPFRYTQKFKKTNIVLLCPDCFSRLVKAKIISEDNEIKHGLIDVILSFVFAIIFVIIINPNDWLEKLDIWELIGNFIIGAGIAATVGQLIIYPLSILVAKPFEKKNNDSYTRWNFDDIPSIRDFMQNDQHTKKRT